jgi:hypothetical protein
MGSGQCTTLANLRNLEAMFALVTEPHAREIGRELLEQSRRDYTAYCQGRRANGQKGGRPRKARNHVVPTVENHVVSVNNHVVSRPLSRSLDLKILDLDPERERSRAREAARPAPTKYPPAWQRRALTVPAWLDAELRRSLNGRAYLLDGIYRQLDDRLVETGETYDSRWIREHVLALAPPVARLATSRPTPGQMPCYDREPPVAGCNHSPACWTPVEHEIKLRCAARAPSNSLECRI